MKSFSRLMLIMLLAIVLIPSNSFAQKRKKNKEKETTQIRPEEDPRARATMSENLILIKAVEREFGSYEIQVDPGKDKEGNNRRYATSSREEEILHSILEAKSLVNILNYYLKRGYDIKSSYAIPEKEGVNHYFLLGNIGVKKDEDTRNQAASERNVNRRRANQNRAKLGPEEIEQRKKAREAARDK
ncbi:MAG: hypothetical protein U9R19_12290 [Bacteroidota bacterium]|nr:hypothetical protein [Bacteroidota bacterium]